MLDAPLPDIESWLSYYAAAELPVLRRTVADLNRLRESAENANARQLSSIILQDPLMTMRVLAYIENRRAKSRTTDIITIEGALMMIGVQPFFRDFQDLPLVEDRLKAHPKALLGLLRLIARGRRASHLARDWALFRHDLNVDEITVVTLLHDIAEILMWCFAPTLALRVRDMQAADRALRSTIAQEQIYNIRLRDLRLGLAKLWNLPELFATLTNRANAEQPRVRNVLLAVDLARHSANGWDDAALPDDYKAIEDLLHINHETLMQRLDLDPQTGMPVPKEDAA